MVEIIGYVEKDKNNGCKRVKYRCECGAIGETREVRAKKQRWCQECARKNARLGKNKYQIIDGYAYIDVSTEKFPDAICVIDEKNIKNVIDGKGRWFASNYCRDTVYAIRSQRCEKMHRKILGATENSVVDHIDGDGLNNTESNIRICCQSENMKNRKMDRRNKTGVTGVCWNKGVKKWHAQGGSNGKRHNLGFYNDFEDAVVARRLFEKENGFTDRHGKRA